MYNVIQALDILKTKEKIPKPICIIDDGQQMFKGQKEEETSGLVHALWALKEKDLTDLLITFSEQTACLKFNESKASTYRLSLGKQRAPDPPRRRNN